LYQMFVPSPISTSPMMLADGAMKAVSWIFGHDAAVGVDEFGHAGSCFVRLQHSLETPRDTTITTLSGLDSRFRGNDKYQKKQTPPFGRGVLGKFRKGESD
jgi:hypothetical protein